MTYFASNFGRIKKVYQKMTDLMSTWKWFLMKILVRNKINPFSLTFLSPVSQFVVLMYPTRPLRFCIQYLALGTLCRPSMSSARKKNKKTMKNYSSDLCKRHFKTLFRAHPHDIICIYELFIVTFIITITVDRCLRLNA